MEEIRQITITEKPVAYWSAHKALYAVDMIATEIPDIWAELADSTKPLIPSRPWSLEIYPTMACQIACTHCYSQLRNREYRFKGMEPQLMEHIHGSIRNMGIRGVQYCGGGEPLLWRNGEIAKHIASLNREVTRAGMASNLLRGESLALPEVLNNMIFIEVPVFAYDDATYKQVAGRDHCSTKVKQAVQLLQDVKRQYGIATPSINAKILINNVNYKWLPQIYRWSQSSAFDNIHLRVVDDYEENNPVTLSPDQRSEFRALMLEFAQVEGLEEWENNIDYILGDKGVRQPYSHCRTIQLGLNAWVISNGEVYVCGPQWGNREYCIGNLHEAPLETIWGGSRHLQCVEAIQKRIQISQCYKVGCRHIKQTMAIDNVIAGNASVPPMHEFESRHAWFL